MLQYLFNSFHFVCVFSFALYYFLLNFLLVLFLEVDMTHEPYLSKLVIIIYLLRGVLLAITHVIRQVVAMLYLLHLVWMSILSFSGSKHNRCVHAYAFSQLPICFPFLFLSFHYPFTFSIRVQHYISFNIILSSLITMQQQNQN